ncbi:PAS domain S-box protein [Spirulina sp. CS-785/01]|uniref:PAS domain S-box protein n=1 Tax=Spirulina sp. CS-785/01 TaxID=3021716 RepID=UPI00232CA004|nr:PAS domain S-box protein [Spirulina sp. CS-785/01]MDB9313491.1 PAS domain S-box protein [Spirulina sp. CS-785/01]
MQFLLSQIQQNARIEEIFSTAVSGVRQMINCDRVVLYRQETPHSGILVAQSGEIVNLPLDSPSSSVWEWFCSPQTVTHRFESPAASLPELQQTTMAAWVTRPIMIQQGGKTRQWGVLMAEHGSPKHWSREALAELENVALLIAIALQQDALWQRVQTTEENFNCFADNSTDLLLRTTLEGVCLYVSPACQSMLGYSPEELLGQPFTHWIHPEDLAVLIQYIDHPQDFPAIVQYRLQHRDGHYIWVEAKGKAVGDPQTQDYYEWYAICRNISDRVAVQKERSRLITILEASTDIIGICDVEGNTIWANQQTRQLLGLTPDCDLTQNSITKYHPPWAIALLLQEAFPTARDKGVWLGETALLTADGQEIPLSQMIIAHYSPQGEIEYFSTIARNISDFKALETQLRDSEQFLRDLLDSLETFVGVMTTDGILIEANRSPLEAAGIQREEVLGKSFDQTYWWGYSEEAPARIRESIENALQGQRVRFDIPVQVKQQEQIIIDFALTPIYNTQGQIRYLIPSGIDISDRKAMETQLRQTNAELQRATRLKDEFLANMSHELRTPLNAILGLSEALQEGIYGSLTFQQQDSLKTIEQSGQHLLQLINDVLDLAKIEAGKMELHLHPVEIATLCHGSFTFIKPLATRKKIQLEQNLDPHTLQIQADELRLRQALLNLLSNAVKFTPEGGKVTLNVQGHPETKTLSFQVIDTGIGIASQDCDRLFDSFVQIDSSFNRHYAGTGLGLALVKRIAEIHQGTIRVTSELGQGSCFTLTLPWQPEQYQPLPPPLPTSPISQPELSSLSKIPALWLNNSPGI